MTTKLEYSEVKTGDTTRPPPLSGCTASATHGSSFVPLVPEFDLSDCPPIHFIFPHAPVRPVTANAGYQMNAWFDIYGGFDAGDREDAGGVQDSKRLIEQLIEEQKANGIAADKIILAGFSQGCAMALETGLCYPEKLGGVIRPVRLYPATGGL